MIGLFLIKFLLKNSIARTNLFGNFAESFRLVILKSIKSSNELVNLQNQSLGQNVFLKISKNLLKNTCGEVFLKSVLHRCFPVNFAKFLRAFFFCRTPLVAAFELPYSHFFISNSSHDFYNIFLAKTLFQNPF